MLLKIAEIESPCWCHWHWSCPALIMWYCLPNLSLSSQYPTSFSNCTLLIPLQVTGVIQRCFKQFTESHKYWILCPEAQHAFGKVAVLWLFSLVCQIHCCHCHLVLDCGTSFWNLQSFASTTGHGVTSPKSAAPSRSTGPPRPLQETLEIQGFTLHVASP